jgi:3-oxocholest-4-en-26-oate---CoA ligase
MHLASVWEAVADAVGDETALIHGDREVTWRQFDDRASRLAAALAELGIRPNAKVAIDLYNCSEFFETFLAALKAGGVPVAINYRYREDELVQLLDDADAEVVVAHASLADRVGAVAPDLPLLRHVVEVHDHPGHHGDEPRPSPYEQLIADHRPAERHERSEDDMYLSYTGGTTGLPKGVMYTMGAVTRQSLRTMPMICGVGAEEPTDPAELARRLRDRGERPVVVPASPLMHSTAFTFASLPALCGGGTVVTLENRRFDAPRLLEAVAQHGATVGAIVGDAFGRPIVEALDEAKGSGTPRDTSTLRVICSAGVAFSADTKRRLLDHMPQVTLVDGCGSTEGGTYGVSTVRRGDDLSTTRFTAAPGTIVLDPNGAEAPRGETGLIAAVTVTSGYYKHPDKTAETFRTIDGRHYVVPGDLGRIDGDGTLTLLGRSGSTINTGGEKVYAEEVEAVLRSFGDVRDAVVVGVPDERLGQVVGAIIGLTEPARSVDELVAAVRERLAGYKVPRHVALDTPPRGPNGKADLAQARQMLAEHVAAEAATVPAR